MYWAQARSTSSSTSSAAPSGPLSSTSFLRAGGQYAIAGAIGGPVSEIDLRTVYLKDLTLYGCTFQPDAVFENLISYIQRNEIRPVVAATYPLAEIAAAQEEFLTKKHTGKLVLIPPPATQTN
ncbi:hypothetical protein SUDANB58_05736 [Streptomyces sp. enrichment culture]|uniref:zinc-binding dehydrogenase n=1 Tax=Streptomyces sp. enrichment culture TaxID=1795815 RepID=UPI003F55369E